MSSEVKAFYDDYGIKEWNRLDENAYSRINYLLHMHFIKGHLTPGMKVLDAGCGTGRFSIEFAKLGCKVTRLTFQKSSSGLRIAKSTRQMSKTILMVLFKGILMKK